LDSSKSNKFDQEKQNLANILLSKQQEIVRLSDDLQYASNQYKELKVESRKDKNILTTIQTEEMQMRSSAAALQQELNQSVKANEWLNEELKVKSHQIVEYRREKTAQISQLQKDLENISQEKMTSNHRNEILNSRLEELEQKYNAKLEKLHELEDSKIISEQQFKSEMISQKKLADLYQSKSVELQTHLKELENLIKSLEIKIVELDEQKQSEKTTSEKEIEELKTLIQTQSLQIEQLESELSVVNKDLMHQNISNQIGNLSETAASASRLQKSGKSVTEIYSDYTNLQKELIKEKSEVARLTDCVNHIVQEFEQRAPIIQKTNEDYQMAKEQIEILSRDLVKSVKEKESALKEKVKVLNEIEKLDGVNIMLERDLKDRSKQIQALLRDQYTEDGGEEEEEIGADEIISKRLVVFRNIEELQTQNASLLRSIRSLSSKMEAQELKETNEIDAQRLEALNESTKMIEQLQEQIKREVLNSESYARERDTWRRMAESRGQSSPEQSPKRNDYETFYMDLQREFDVYRKECGTDTRMLKQQLDEKSQENTNLSIKVAKLQNQIEYLNERNEMYTKSLEIKSKEFEQLHQRLQTTDKMNQRQDLKIEEIQNSLNVCRQELNLTSSECQQLKIEKQLWKTSEQRSLKENQGLVRERNEANDRVRELQDHISLQDRKQQAQVKKLESKIEELGREIFASRKQIQDLGDDNRQLSARRSAELNESQIKIERLVF
jgi:nucleoprotein TPR